MSNLNFGTYDSENTDVLNDPEYGYLLQDDLFIMDSSQKKVVKDLYVKNGQNWSQVKEAYIYDQGQWKVSYRKAFRFKIDFTDSTMNLNLLTYLRSLSTSWDGVSPIKGIFRITNTGVIGSNNSTIPSLMIPTLPANSSLIIINDGSLYGQGGNGGQGAAIDRNGFSGQNGGDCININIQSQNTRIYYSGSGLLWAGGGGGGGGAYSYEGSDGGSDTRSAGGGGGGGQGYSTSLGGPGGPLPNPSGAFGGRNAAGSPGSNGGFNSAGNGGGGGGPSNWGPCAGGTGGSWGADGNTGVAVTAGSKDTNPGEGGFAGCIINGINNITFLEEFPSPINGYINNSTYKGRIL